MRRQNECCNMWCKESSVVCGWIWFFSNSWHVIFIKKDIQDYAYWYIERDCITTFNQLTVTKSITRFNQHKFNKYDIPKNVWSDKQLIFKTAVCNLVWASNCSVDLEEILIIRHGIILNSEIKLAWGTNFFLLYLVFLYTCILVIYVPFICFQGESNTGIWNKQWL